MNKLVDHFGTKYFASHFANDVRIYLDTVDEIDIADARICRDVMKYVDEAVSRGVVVRDTLDPERDAYLLENKRRRDAKSACAPTRVLPFPASVEEVIPTIKSLSSKEIYRMQSGASPEHQAFAALVEAARPDICINPESYVRELLFIVYDNLFPNPHVWEEYYVLIGNTFYIKKVAPEEVHDFLLNNIAVPTDFGTKNLTQLPEWDHCLNKLMQVLQKGLRPKNRKIKDYLEV